MVSKLFKYEFMAIGRTVVPAAAILLVSSLLSSVSLLLPYEDAELLQSLLVSFFALCSAGVLCASFCVCITRFEKSLFSKEGYFTLALPVTPIQLLLVKTVSSVITIVFSFLVTLLATEIFAVMQGVDVLGIIVSEIILQIINPMFQTGFGGVFVYTVIVALFGLLSQLLFIYACISAGQLVNKHRALVGIVVYFVVNQILSYVLSFIISFIETNSVTLLTAYIWLTIYLVSFIAVGVASMFFIRYVLKNKVNLLA